MMDAGQLHQYFRRIGYQPVSGVSLDTLSCLQRNHVQTIPFENLNPLLGLPVKIDFESVFQKIVIEGRGGYCYEQNTLFFMVLRTIGFDVQELAARVLHEDDKIVSARTHKLLLVNLGNRLYIADVGFGGLICPQPLLLRPGLLQQTSHETYRILSGGTTFTSQIFIQNEWRSLYEFDFQKQIHIDDEMGNWFVSTFPKSYFTSNLMVSLVGENGRYTLNNRRFSVYHLEEEPQKQELLTPKQMLDTLRNVFKINLSRLPDLEKILTEKLFR